MVGRPQSVGFLSPHVLILTVEEMKIREAAAFQRGVERGRFECLCEAQKDKGQPPPDSG